MLSIRFLETAPESKLLDNSSLDLSNNYYGSYMNVEVTFEGKSWHADLRSPFSPYAGDPPREIPGGEWSDSMLHWYFEEYYRFPLESVKKERAELVLEEYGRLLFNMVVPPEKLKFYSSNLVKEVVVKGSPHFHTLYWESLRDDDCSAPLAMRVPLTRLPLESTEEALAISDLPSDQLNVLLVTPRPSGPQDIKLRTISMPLVSFAKDHLDLRLKVHVLRPATFESLSKHLEDRPGFYHILHFDGHGDVLTKQQVDDLMDGKKIFRHLKQGADQKGYSQDVDMVNIHFEGVKPCLLFESGDGENCPNPVDGADMLKVVTNAKIPIVVLDACRSGFGSEGQSLASMLMKGEAAAVIGNGFSVLVDASKLFIVHLYQQLFAGGKSIDEAVRIARAEMNASNKRQARLNEQISLADWMLPRLFSREGDSKLKLEVKSVDSKDQEKWSNAMKSLYEGDKIEYEFVGREREVQMIEERVLREQRGANILLLRGMGGVGKTTLMEHLGKWWHTSDFIEGVFEFAYDKKAYTVETILSELGRKLMGEKDFASISLEGYKIQMEILCPKLRRRRFLIILDNLESIANRMMDYDHILNVEEQKKLRELLVNLQMERGTQVLGKDAATPSIILLGSCSNEDWLMKDSSFEKNIMDLEGLDEEAQEELAFLVMGKEKEKHSLKPMATRLAREAEEDQIQRSEMLQLMKMLGGFPLAIKAVISTLGPKRSPSKVLEELEFGIDFERFKISGAERSQNLMKYLKYSFGALEEEEQMMLQCLFPFHGVLMKGKEWKNYVEELKKREYLKNLPHQKWDNLLEEACNRGFIIDGSSLHYNDVSYYNIQPMFPFYLRCRPENDKANLSEDQRREVREAFADHMIKLSGTIIQFQESKKVNEFQRGLIMARLEEENLVSTCRQQIQKKKSFYSALRSLDLYWQLMKQFAQGLGVMEDMKAIIGDLEVVVLDSEFGKAWNFLCDAIAFYKFNLKMFKDAESEYMKLKTKLESDSSLPMEKRMKDLASIYHQLGMIAAEQSNFSSAERHYRKALGIYIRFNYRHEQALEYHQMGVLAQSKHEYSPAFQYYCDAVKIYEEFSDRLKGAGTYHNLGALMQQMRDFSSAERYYCKALNIYVEFNDRFEQAAVYHQLGMLAEEQGHFASAKKKYYKALDIKSEINDRHSLASTYHELGNLAFKLLDFSSAEQHYRKALGICTEFKDRHKHATVLYQLGLVSEQQNDISLTGQRGHEALEISVDINDRHLQALTYHLLGRVALRQHDFKSAEQICSKALEIFESIGDDCNVENVRRSMTCLLSFQWQFWQFAASAGDMDAVKKLLDDGFNVDACDDEGLTALMFACVAKTRNSPELVRLLLEKGADASKTDNEGDTALHFAARKDNAEAIRLLVAADGVEIEARGLTSESPLIYAAESNSVQAIDALLDCGAQIDAVDSEGDTALIYAAREGHLEAVRTLLGRSADVNARGLNGSTALSFAYAGGFSSVVRLLKESGGNAP